MFVLSVHSQGGERGYTLAAYQLNPTEQQQTYPSKGSQRLYVTYADRQSKHVTQTMGRTVVPDLFRGSS